MEVWGTVGDGLRGDTEVKGDVVQKIWVWHPKIQGFPPKWSFVAPLPPKGTLGGGLTLGTGGVERFDSKRERFGSKIQVSYTKYGVLSPKTVLLITQSRVFSPLTTSVTPLPPSDHWG